MFRVLIVDDEPMIRKGLMTLVQQYKPAELIIHTAENGESALKQIREEAPDILLTDIRMPKMDGLELSRSIHGSCFDIDIVIISGYSDFEYARQCMAVGVKEYLLKPVVKKSLYDVLQKVIEGRKNKVQSHVSAATLADWAERMEQAIWSLRMEELEALTAEWRAYCHNRSYSPNDLYKLQTDLLELLTKKLNSRGPHSFQEIGPLKALQEPAAAHDRFDEQLLKMAEELKRKRKGKAKDPVEVAKLYIEAHLSGEIPLEEVADLLGLNPSYFSQLFKQQTRETFVQYRIRRRMEKAKQLLEQPYYRITDISYEVGYADHPHFTKTFKKYTGCSPSEYRQKLGIE
jgi:two-component system, response regulator YesN